MTEERLPLKSVPIDEIQRARLEAGLEAVKSRSLSKKELRRRFMTAHQQRLAYTYKICFSINFESIIDRLTPEEIQNNAYEDQVMDFDEDKEEMEVDVKTELEYQCLKPIAKEYFKFNYIRSKGFCDRTSWAAINVLFPPVRISEAIDPRVYELNEIMTYLSKHFKSIVTCTPIAPQTKQIFSIKSGRPYNVTFPDCFRFEVMGQSIDMIPISDEVLIGDLFPFRTLLLDTAPCFANESHRWSSLGLITPFCTFFFADCMNPMQFLGPVRASAFVTAQFEQFNAFKHITPVEIFNAISNPRTSLEEVYNAFYLATKPFNIGPMPPLNEFMFYLSAIRDGISLWERETEQSIAAWTDLYFAILIEEGHFD